MRPSLVVGCVVLLVTAGCAGRASEPDQRVAAAYADVFQVVLGAEPLPPVEKETDLVVWIYPLADRGPIDLEVQVEVLDLLQGVVTARFVDDFAEAVEEVDGDFFVLDEGVAIGLGPFEPGGDLVTAERFSSRDEEPVEYALALRDRRWQVIEIVRR